MVVSRPPIVSVATRSVLSRHRATVTEVAAHHVAKSAEDQVSCTMVEVVLSEDVLFGKARQLLNYNLKDHLGHLGHCPGT